MKYHKIQSLYKRDPETKFKTFLDGEWTQPEFEYLQHQEWVWTEKVDGTNIRVIWDGHNVTFGGRTDNAQLHAGLVEHLQETFTVDLMANLLGEPGDPVTLFGEGYGEKIQRGGGNYRTGQSFVLFDAWCGMWLKRESLDQISCDLDIEIVPVVGSGGLLQAIEYVKSKPESQWGPFPAEGIVLRPAVELLDRRGSRIITKLKYKDFQSKQGDGA